MSLFLRCMACLTDWTGKGLVDITCYYKECPKCGEGRSMLMGYAPEEEA